MQNLWRCRCRRVIDLKLNICAKNQNERGTCEQGLSTQTTSEHNPLQSTFYVVGCLLHIRREFSSKQFSERKLEHKNSLTLEPNENVISMENIAVQVHQGNKVLNGKMRVPNFFEQRYIFLCFYSSVLIILMLCKLVSCEIK